jgi:hypothetical protein
MKIKHSMEDIIKEHLPYEMAMLRATFKYLQLDHGEVIDNALINSFCVHARNLIDFFAGTKEAQDRSIAKTFTDPAYNPFKGHDVRREPIYGKLNKQITHLAYGRATADSEKIGPKDWEALLRLINEEADNFVSHLKPVYKRLWPEQIITFDKQTGTTTVTLGKGPSGSSLPTYTMLGREPRNDGIRDVGPRRIAKCRIKGRPGTRVCHAPQPASPGPPDSCKLAVHGLEGDHHALSSN